MTMKGMSKPTRKDDKDYAFQSYINIQNLANTVDSTDDPVVKKALLMIRRFPGNRSIIDNHIRLVERHLKPKLKVRELFPNPFEPNPVNVEVDGSVRIGVVKSTSASFGLNLDELGEHMLLAGRAGAGKTTLIYIILYQLIEQGIPFWAFDFKQDYRHLSRAGDVLVFDWESFRFNPLRPPPSVKPKLWMQAFTNIFCQSYYLLAGTKSILIEHINKLYEDYGVFENSDVYPTMLDLKESLKGHKLIRKQGRQSGFWESAITRLDECLLGFSDMLNCDKGFLLEELLTKNVVFEVEGLLAENQAFLLMIILRYVFQYRISNNQRSGLKHVFLFDEAKSVYNKKKEFDPKIGISEIARFTSTIREFGEGLVVADQMPAELADSIKSNVYSVICMSQSGGTNVTEMSRAIGLNREQSDAMRMLQSDKAENVFEAVVKLSGKWLTPFIIHVLHFKAEKNVSNPDIQAFMSPLLGEMSQRMVPRTEYRLILEGKQKQEEELKKGERKGRQDEAVKKEEVEGNILIKILTNIRDYPFADQKARIEMLGLEGSSATVNKYFRQLINKGYATTHRVGLGRGQSTKVFYEITKQGKEFAQMDKAEIPGKGDFRHKFWQHVIKSFYHGLGYGAEIEKRFGIKNVDIGFEHKGKKTAVEVELSPDHLIENIQRDLDAGCDEIIIAVNSKRAIQAYKKKIDYYNKDFLERIEFRVLADFLEQ